MENQRQIRWIYPPFILIGSILLGYYLDEKSCDLWTNIKDIKDFKDIIIVIIGGGIVVLVTGYIIGTITFVFLRIISNFSNNGFTYEINRRDDFTEIEKIILVPNIRGERDMFYASVTYEHGVGFPEKIHIWVQRRWDSYHTSANSAVALLLSILMRFLAFEIHNFCWIKFASAYFLQVPLLSITFLIHNIVWLIIVLILMVFFICHSIRARRETIGMINFQTRVKRNKDLINLETQPNQP